MLYIIVYFISFHRDLAPCIHQYNVLEGTSGLEVGKGVLAYMKFIGVEWKIGMQPGAPNLKGIYSYVASKDAKKRFVIWSARESKNFVCNQTKPIKIKNLWHDQLGKNW